MNNFTDDNVWQRSVRDAVLVPQFYEKYATDGRYVLVDKGRFADIIQQRLDVDTIMQSKDGAVVAIEEKIVRWPGYNYTALCLETESCTVKGHESDGWMHFCEADYLLYCLQQQDGGLKCYLINFAELYKWFWPVEKSLNVFEMKTQNRTRGRLAPIADVRKHCGVAEYNLVAA